MRTTTLNQWRCPSCGILHNGFRRNACRNQECDEFEREEIELVNGDTNIVIMVSGKDDPDLISYLESGWSILT